MRWLTILALASVMVGCTPSTPETSAASEAPGERGLSSAATVSNQGGGIAPMTTAPIPNAPISGAESVGGGGSAVGSVAKDRAKQTAAQASTPNMGTGSEGE